MPGPSRTTVLLVLLLAAAPAAANAERPNVLLICLDDLRCSLGCYGDDVAVTPNLDALAAKSRVFRRHYAFSAASGPSRAALLSGRQLLDGDFLRLARELQAANELDEPAEAVSLPHSFRKQGYATVCVGRVSPQPGGVLDVEQTVHELPFSWDRSFAPTGAWKTPMRAYFSYAGGRAYNRLNEQVNGEPPQPPFEAGEVGDDGYADGLNAQAAIEQLSELSKQQQPFFLAVGFYKPSLPFNSPKKYWDLYDSRQFKAAPWPKPPANAPANITLHNSYEPTTHYAWPSGAGNINAQEAAKLKHAYYAAVSYVDAQIGRVIDEVERLGLDKDTVVVVWSDQGWHLGDHGVWGQATNYEWALRSPLIIRTPGLPRAGEPCDGIVESIDIYPTLMTVCGLKEPLGLPGRDLSSNLKDPSAPGKTTALSILQKGNLAGAAIRTDQHRMVEWLQLPQGQRVLLELYDHESDPMESANIAAKQPGVAEQLNQQLVKAVESYRFHDEAFQQTLASVLRAKTPVSYPTDPFTTHWLPWIVLGGMALVLNVLLFLSPRKRAADNPASTRRKRS